MAKPKSANSDSKKIVQRNEKGQLLPGVILNPEGKKAGTLDFKTKWLRFVDKVAAQNNITPDEVDEQLLAVAFKQAKDANYPFWKDIHDRVHGKAEDKIKLDANVEVDASPEIKALADKLNALYSGSGVGSDGTLTGTLDDKAQGEERSGDADRVSEEKVPV
jgi:hypothetical protein